MFHTLRWKYLSSWHLKWCLLTKAFFFINCLFIPSHVPLDVSFFLVEYKKLEWWNQVNNTRMDRNQMVRHALLIDPLSLFERYNKPRVPAHAYIITLYYCFFWSLNDEISIPLLLLFLTWDCIVVFWNSCTLFNLKSHKIEVTVFFSFALHVSLILFFFSFFFY